MRITPNTQTIGQLFFTTSEQFFIPPYQRRYAWGIKQLDALFNDINNLGEDESHLLGTIIFLSPPHTAGVNKLELVDGQQRITTLCLLLKVLREEFKKNKSSDFNEIDNFLNIRSNNESNLSKVELGDLDNDDFKKIMHGSSMEEIKNKNLLFAYNYFQEKSSDLGGKLINFYNKLKNRIVVIRLDIGEAKDAYKLFESINNRGLRLTVTDIIKNFLLGHASIIDNKTLEMVKNNWTDLVVNLDEIDSDKFIRHYMMGRLKVKVPYSKLADHFKDYYYVNVEEANILSDYNAHLSLIERNNEDSNYNLNTGDGVEGEEINHDKIEKYKDKKISIINFSKELKKSSGVYAKIINKSFEGNSQINQLLIDLERIESTPTLTFLLNLFQRALDDKEIEEILKLLQSFMLRRHICKYRTSELDDIFSKLVSIKNDNIVKNIKSQLNEYLPGDEEFKDKFAKADFKGLENRAKYILEQLEYNYIHNMNEYKLLSGSEVHLEHIIPQTINTKKSIKEFGNWPKYLGNNSIEKHKNYVWRIGNLTILAQELNIKASNNPYRAKLKEYKKSNIVLNKKITDEFGGFRFRDVEKRSKEFAELAVKIWGF